MGFSFFSGFRSPLLSHHIRLALAPRVAAQSSEHAKEMQDQPRQNEGRVATHHHEEPDDSVDELPLVELAETGEEETQHGGQARAPALHGRLIDHDDLALAALAFRRVLRRLAGRHDARRSACRDRARGGPHRQWRHGDHDANPRRDEHFCGFPQSRYRLRGG